MSFRASEEAKEMELMTTMNDWERFYDAWKTSAPAGPEPDEDELFYEAADRAMDERE